MDITFFFYLSSGLFLGWSLGASDTANIFGTAVGTKMIKFRTAALTASLFIIIGAVSAGGGASQTLGTLGAVNTLPGSFMVALAAALTIYWMIELSLPTSTSQAIVGAIIGWNFYAGKPTDIAILTKIVSTWVICPLLSGSIAILLYLLLKGLIRKSHMHLLQQDSYTRIALLSAGAFGAYALGANNIANVMGVFVNANPLQGFNIGNLIQFNPTQVLFLIGGIAVGSGVITHSQKLMRTIGEGVMKMSPLIALVIVLSQSLVLFLFASPNLHNFLITHSLPALPLVPVSSSQAVIGAVIGIGIAKGGKELNWGILLKTAGGWVCTPAIAALVCYVSLFFLQNVFGQTVYLP